MRVRVRAAILLEITSAVGINNFARQMKSICKLQSNIECDVLDGKNGGKGTPCDEVQRCTIVDEDIVNGVSKLCTCPDCIQDVRYDFEYTNSNNQALRLGSEVVTTSNAKIRWQTVQDNRDYFRDDVPAKNTSKFTSILFVFKTIFDAITCRYTLVLKAYMLNSSHLLSLMICSIILHREVQHHRS